MFRVIRSGIHYSTIDQFLVSVVLSYKQPFGYFAACGSFNAK
jgi:hypothetical protein